MTNRVSTQSFRGIPDDLSEKLIKEFLEIKKRFAMRDWGPGQLNGGRFAEVILRIFQHLLGKPITPFGTDMPANEKTSIINSIQNHPTIDEHIRQKITAIVRLQLDFRNNRDVAHLGGFDANSMDATFVMTSASWALCELLRVYGGLPMDEAQELVNGLSTKEYPVLMKFEGDLYIARHDLQSKEEVLVLLYTHSKLDFDELLAKTRDKNRSRFRNMLAKMIQDRFIEQKDDDYFLMPRGMKTVEEKQLLKYAD